MVNNPQSEISSNSLNRLFSQSFTINWEVVVLVVILVAAIFTRFHDLGARAMSHDESLHTRFSYNLSEDGNFQHTPLMHGPILFHATALSYTLFGDNDFTSRIYTSILGVLLVMSPLLFRRWLGRWGTILACLMLLISPVTLYYGRYIRHDMPSILSALVMIWAIFMYTNGGSNQERRAHWLYIVAVGMIWNLGSKETAFIYIAIIGIFLFLYFLARLWQYLQPSDYKGKPIFFISMMGVFVGGVMSLGMYILLDIIKFDMLQSVPETSFFALSNTDQSLVIIWSIIIFVVMALVTMLTMVWAYREHLNKLPWGELLAVLGIAFFICSGFVVIEELSHVAESGVLETAQPVDPTSGETVASTSNLSWTPMILVWIVTLIGFVILFLTRRRSVAEVQDKDKLGQGFWGTLDLFPEFDLIIVIGTLILPWATAFIPYLMGGTPADYTSIAQALPFGLSETIVSLIPAVPDEAMVGQVTLGLMAFIPLITFSWALGLMWNWKRWLITSAVFHVLFAFFFTTIFTNMVGLATGMVYSLGYWLEQQGVRRGSQPQYYYLLIIMPIYEFLPIIGSVFAMFSGLGAFWTWRKQDNSARLELQRRERLDYLISMRDANETSDSGEDIQSDVIAMIESEVEEAKAFNLNEVVGRLYARNVASSLYAWALFILSIFGISAYILTGFRVALIPGPLLLIPLAMYLYYLYRETRHEVLEKLDEGRLPEEIAPPSVDTITSDTPRNYLLRVRDRARLNNLPFLIFFSWLAILNLVGYSLAGEKMPWLATHLTMPMIFLSAWFFGGVVEKINLEKFKQQGWIALVVMLLFFVAFFQALQPLFMGIRPFSGITSDALRVTYSWIAAVVIAGGALAVLFKFAEKVSWQHVGRMAIVALFGLLSVLTLRVALLASFVNYDYATEFLVYAHAAPGVNWVLDDIEEISLATTDGYDVSIIYDNEVSWPYSWYFRDYTNVRYVGSTINRRDVDEAVVILVGAANRPQVDPLVEDRYVRFDHIRLWWPMQDYFNLNPTRLANLFDPTDPTAAQLRQGIFDIWWNRDYETYGLASGGDFSVTNWPVSDRMHLYVRRDVAAQIWSYGVGEGTVNNPLTSGEVNQCSANWQPLLASRVLQDVTSPMTVPIGVDVAPDGTVYVAEQGVFGADSLDGNRITVFDPETSEAASFGIRGNTPADSGTISFLHPNGVAVLDDGSFFVADTWNHRIQYFDADRNLITSWGQLGEFGLGAPVEPVNAFWGPRDVAVDEFGRIFVADTGNKRVRVYQLVAGNVQYLYDIGEGGSGQGQLDEPTGLAISQTTGYLYVADTWNRRISVFSADGSFIQTFNVSGWYEERGNRPYLAIDDARQILYVTDPDAGRVLVYSLGGECIGSFGELAQPEPTNSQFGVVSGIATNEDGAIYVADSRLGRVLVFPPFPYLPPQPESAQPADDTVGEGDGSNIEPETTVEVSEPEATTEIIQPEVTAEITDETSE